MDVSMVDLPMESVYYVWWPLATIAIIVLLSFITFLMGVIAVFAKRIIAKLDIVSDTLQEVKIDSREQKTELHGHIENEGMHCKQGACLRRVADG